MSRVDILTPVHNTRLDWVREAIQSAIDQTFRDWKLLIVDDGSRPEYASALESMIASYGDRRLVYITTPNRGPASARNTAIRSSNSDYLAILDSDDTWCPEKLERQVAFLDAHPEIALVHANHDLVWTDGSRRPGRRTVKNFNELTSSELVARVLRNNIVGHGESLFRRSAAEMVGLYDEQLKTVEDKDLLLRMLLAGCKYHYLDETVYLYRWHASNSTKNIEGQLRGRLTLMEKMDARMSHDARWAHLPWTAIKRDVSRNAWRQAVEGYLERRDYWRALRYSVPIYCGWSVYSGRLVLRSAYGLLKSQGRRPVVAAP